VLTDALHPARRAIGCPGAACRRRDGGGCQILPAAKLRGCIDPGASQAAVGPRRTDEGASPDVAAKLVGCWKLDVARRRADDR